MGENEGISSTVAETPVKLERQGKQRAVLLWITSAVFGLAGMVLLNITFCSTEEATLTFAYDLLKVWMGALIGLVSSMGTYYFAGE